MTVYTHTYGIAKTKQVAVQTHTHTWKCKYKHMWQCTNHAMQSHTQTHDGDANTIRGSAASGDCEESTPGILLQNMMSELNQHYMYKPHDVNYSQYIVK